MKKINFLFVSLVALFLIIACTTNPKAVNAPVSPTARPDVGWASRMQGVAKSLEELLPYVFSRQEFNDPANKAKIHDLMDQFSKSVGVIPLHVGEAMLGQDPIVKYSVERLRSNTYHAVQSFNEGQIEYSRSVLSENMGLCFSCHTTSQFGPENNFSSKGFKPEFKIFATEKSDYYVATRQFDRAVSMLESILTTPADLLDDPHEQVAALRKYLSLEVRVKKDPARAASVLENFLHNQKLPYFVASETESWLRSLREWQAMMTSKMTSVARAQVLLKRAESRQVEGYQSGFVEYLRASALLHEGLRETPKLDEKANIYFMLGQCYDTLSEMGTWDLPEIYFEACVRTSPKSELAKKCYKSFEKSIVMGFSGSAGIFIPKDERERMSELKALAGL